MSLSPSALRKSIHQNKKIIESMQASELRLAQEIVDYALLMVKFNENSRIAVSNLGMVEKGYLIIALQKAQPIINGASYKEPLLYCLTNSLESDVILLYSDITRENQITIALHLHDLLFPEDKI